MRQGDISNHSDLHFSAHTGTHVDAPLHFLEAGNDVTKLALDTLIGPAFVALLPEIPSITAQDLEGLSLPSSCTRLLLRTRNSGWWTTEHREFRKDYTALSIDAARWVVDHRIRLIGVDYLSVQRFHDGPETHRCLLEADVVLLEGLNLTGVAPGRYELICLPLKLAGAEGAPARAVLREL